MELNPYAPDFDDLPEVLPVFPLGGVLLLPGGHLPLNVFEKRYVAMIADALAGGRLVGIIQPREAGIEKVVDDTPLFKTGCAGKITEFTETPDGRFEIKLTGICRFDIATEAGIVKGYRSVRPDWSPYRSDLLQGRSLDIDRAHLKELLKKYFEGEGMTCDWSKVEDVPDGKLMTCLSMVCPFDAGEKQALLEARSCAERAKMFMTMLEMAVSGGRPCRGCH